MVINEETFKFKGAIPVELGWREVYHQEEKALPPELTADLPLPDEAKRVLARYPPRRECLAMLRAQFKKGQVCKIDDLQIVEKETAPPKAYTDGTLLNAMRYIGRQVDDESLARQLKDQGLGTQATRASMIERLIKTQYVVRRGKSLHPTDKGIALIETVIPDLKSPELTAQWEIRLSEIQDGRLKQEVFMDKIKQFVQDLIPQIRSAPGQRAALNGRESLGRCPKCKKGRMYEGKKNYYCSEYRQGCDFVLWWKVAGKTIAKEQLVKIIESGRSDFIEGFISKQGKPFSAILELDASFKTRFSFNKGGGRDEMKPSTLPAAS